MTREEALKQWLPIVVMGVREMPEVKEAVKMAITALESKSESESRMSYVQETVNAILNTCNTDSIADKAMRNAAKFVQNAIDGSYPDFEKLEQEPCEDCISRSEALSVFRPIGITEDVWKECDVYKKLTALQTVTPRQKMGRWINDKCSECGKGIEDLIDSPEWYRNEEPNFCPYCGIKMEKIEDDRR